MSSAWTASTIGALAVLASRWAYRRLVAGDLVIDLSIGRTIRPLGPIDARIEAPRELVFDVIAAPYLASPPSSLAEKIQVLERSDEMVLAAHRTPIREGLIASTVETVRFERPGAVYFRLMRGPVPHVIERFDLAEDGDATLFHSKASWGLTCGLWVAGGTPGGQALGRSGTRVRRRNHADRRDARRASQARASVGLPMSLPGPSRAGPSSPGPLGR